MPFFLSRRGAAAVDIVIPGREAASPETLLYGDVGVGRRTGVVSSCTRGSTTILSARWPVMGQCISLPSHESERRCTLGVRLLRGDSRLNARERKKQDVRREGDFRISTGENFFILMENSCARKTGRVSQAERIVIVEHFNEKSALARARTLSGRFHFRFLLVREGDRLCESFAIPNFGVTAETRNTATTDCRCAALTVNF